MRRMNTIPRAAITMLLFANITSGSESKFQKEIAKRTGITSVVAAIVVSYLGFFKITGPATVCYDKERVQNQSYVTFNANGCIQRSLCLQQNTSNTTIPAAHSYFNLQSFAITHAPYSETVAADTVSKEIPKTKETTAELRYIVGKKIIPQNPQTAAITTPERDKLIVFNPRSNFEVLRPNVAPDNFPSEEALYNSRILVYPIDSTDKDKSSCCSIS